MEERSQQLSPTSSLTVGWLETILQRACHTKRRFKSCTVAPIGGNMGFMAYVALVNFDWEEEAEQEHGESVHAQLPSSVVVKMPTHDKAVKAWSEGSGEASFNDQQAVTTVAAFHQNECDAYAWLSSDPPVPLPSIYYSHGTFDDDDQPSAIVMQDLSACQIVDIIAGFNRNQLFAVADAIAALHARTITEPNDHWTRISFQRLQDDPKINHDFLNMVVGMGALLKQLRADLFGTNIDILFEKHFNQAAFEDKERLLKNNELFAVLVHGDLWSTNLLWEGDELRGIIDWQLAHPGEVTEDLQRLMVTCLSPSNRRQWTRPVLAHYYAALIDRLAARQRTPPFSFDDVEQSWRRMLVYTAGMTVFAAGMWINSPVVEGRPDKADRIEQLLTRTKAVLDDALAAVAADSK